MWVAADLDRWLLSCGESARRRVAVLAASSSTVPVRQGEEISEKVVLTAGRP